MLSKRGSQNVDMACLEILDVHTVAVVGSNRLECY